MKIKSIFLAVIVLVSVSQEQQDAGASPEASNEHWRGVHVGISSRKAVEQLIDALDGKHVRKHSNLDDE